MIAIVIGELGMVPNQEHIIDEIGQNTEKSPEDSRRLAVTQTAVKVH